MVLNIMDPSSLLRSKKQNGWILSMLSLAELLAVMKLYRKLSQVIGVRLLLLNQRLMLARLGILWKSIHH